MKDVVFISDLIDKLSAEYNIDPQRVYASGLSNGGGMSFMLSCTLADRIAAIGGVSGAYLYPWESCNPVRPVPLIAFHGMEDEVVPYFGGPSKMFDVPFPDTPGWMAEYARRNGCTTENQLPAQGQVSGVQYSNCDANAGVIFYTISDGGHSWPGGDPLPKSIVGKTSQDLDATRTMWQFFLEHPLPEK
jgi:polyhydroxybutyrate depolymerase